MDRPFSLRLGTTSGTVLSIVPNMWSQDILRTVILAAVGAAVSFMVSWLLQRTVREKQG